MSREQWLAWCIDLIANEVDSADRPLGALAIIGRICHDALTGEASFYEDLTPVHRKGKYL